MRNRKSPTIQTRKKISKSLMGHPHFAPNYKHSEKVLQQMSENRKGKAIGENSGRWKGGISKNQKEYHRTYQRQWRKENKELVNFYDKKRRLDEMDIRGSHTLSEWEGLKMKYNYMCLCCKKTEPEITLTEDHIVPISKGGLNTIDNIQPLCRSCNSRKSVKIIKYSYLEN